MTDLPGSEKFNRLTQVHLGYRLYWS